MKESLKLTPCGVVTLLTDFGLSDGYVAAMKGVLLRLAPGLQIVDVTHQVPRHDVVAGAYLLETVAPYFPPGTVHVVVIDPGVGSERAGLALRAGGSYFVGPDNGVLRRAVRGRPDEAVVIERTPGFDGERSATFHGRDLFAPAAAHLSRTGDPSALGSPIEAFVELTLPKAGWDAKGRVVGEVIHVDGFGNCITNIGRSDLVGPLEAVTIEVAGRALRGVVGCYADARVGEPCLLFGSDGNLEVALREGSAAEALGLGRGASVIVTLAGSRGL